MVDPRLKPRAASLRFKLALDHYGNVHASDTKSTMRGGRDDLQMHTPTPVPDIVV